MLPGNLLYVLSYQRRSLALLLLVRLLNGLGSARAANRRYTADYVSKCVGAHWPGRGVGGPTDDSSSLRD